MAENENFSNQANNLLLQAEEKTAKMSGNPETNHIGATLLCLSLIAAGLAGNYLNFPVFLNIDFLFGSIFAMLVLQFFGLGRGILAAAIISSYTYILWNHPYAIVIMTAETAVVGLLMKRRKMGMVLADTLYWLIIGMPLAYIFYRIVMHVPFSGTSIVMTKQAVNGIANALVARLIFTGFSLRSRSSLTSFSEIIYNLLTFFVLFPALIMLAIGSRADFAETDSKIRAMLIQDSQLANQFLETWVVNRETAVVNLADMAATRSPEQIQSYLELTKKSDGNFLRIGLLDREANITAYFPLVDELGQKNIGKNFADRPFIPKLKQTLKPMLSEVVMGRIGAPKPMITMLAPLVVHGEYDGYITGILSMEQIREHLDKSSQENTIFYTLIDKNGNIIMTSRTDQKVMTQFERANGSINPLGAGISQWVPVVPPNTSIMERWRNSSYIAETTIGRLAEWKLILEQPVSPFQKKLNDSYSGKLTLLYLILLGALFLAGILTRRSIVTLDKLCLITHDLPGRLLVDGKDIAWPESGIMETNYLISNFIEMADALSGQFREVQQTQDALKLAYAEMEMRVHDRTADLIETNKALTAEITERKQMEKALKKSEERLALALKANQDAVWDWDLLANALYYSPHWWNMVGYVENELEADPDLWRRLMHPEDLERAWQIVNEAITGGTSFEVESRLLHKDGHYVPVLTRGYILCNDSGKAVRISGTNSDLTESKKVEEEKRQWELLRQQLQKVESLNRMAGAVAHHFNNQLQVVTGNLEMAMDDLPQNSPTSGTLTEALKAAHRAAEISGMMVAYRGQTPGKHEHLDLSETCRQNLPLLQAAAPKGMILKAVFPASGPVICANAGQIQQILTNLVTNAWESVTENQGAIDLNVKTVSNADIPASKRLPINWKPQESFYACVEVTDTGCGIADKDIDKIFDPFFTTKFIGRGMGLSVVLGIAGAHGGGITVESKLGRGSIFRIFLPVTTEKVLTSPVKIENAPEIKGSGSILLVEDEEQVRNMSRIMLTRLGYTVLEAKDGVDAVEIFQLHQDEIRGVLSDLTMPRMNGWETLAALRKISPNIPVILSSGYDEAQVMADEHTEQPNAFLGKPYRLQDLAETISSVLAKEPISKTLLHHQSLGKHHAQTLI